MLLVQIEPDHLAREALGRCKKKCRERWEVDYVVQYINDGHAGLFAMVDEGKRVAHIVVERLVSFEVTLNVWIAVGSRGSGTVGDVVDLFDGLARSVGAAHWKWESPRMGWAKMLEPYITAERKVYERKVP